MRTETTGPRVLLRHLREVMAETLGAQERLDKIVRHIAASMVAEVCSVYVLRTDRVLELYATEGLRPEAVHEASLKVGKGLVGTIVETSRPLNLYDAKSHPAFVYLSETGEEIYNSFLGVPILRAGRPLGVLVVQNMANRTYTEYEVEALETSAMLIAELMAAGELEGLSKTGTELDLNRSIAFKGTGLSDGIGLGHVVLHEPRVVVKNLFNEDVDAELERLDKALNSLRISINDMLERRDMPHEGEHREVLEAYRMFANDSGWVRRLKEAIENGLTSEAAVEKVQSDNRARMMGVSDPYLRERLHDFDDLAYRLLRQLLDNSQMLPMDYKDRNYIVVARNMGAAELLDYAGPKMRGLVLEEGTPTSHVVIVARAMGIPVAGQIKNMVSLAEQGNAIIVDGDEGVVNLRPQVEVETAYVEKVRFRATRQKKYQEFRSMPSVTADGQDVELLINAGLVMDLAQLEAAGAAGIGLFRTELQFMVASRFPRPGEQEQLYKTVLDHSGEKPVTFRSLDIGGDKVLPYLQTIQEENPALGWRAIRLSLDRPGLIRGQVRAMLKAGAGRRLKLMLPMITDYHEIDQARKIIDHEMSMLTKFGYELPTDFKIGSMIEVPSLIWQLEEVFSRVDFVSVGSNDLFQFMMASDRGNSRIASRFDPMSRSFLRALRCIIEKAHEADMPTTLCGEIAGRPLTAMALLGLGYRSLSMSPASIGPVKAMLLELDTQALSSILLPAIERSDDRQTLRELLMDFADHNGIPY